MNELEKMSPATDDIKDDAAASNAVAPTVCVEEESPALDIAEVADNEPEAKVKTKGYHSMDKAGLLEALKEILESGNMEAHKEVAAIKQAYYTLSSRENLNELTAFVEAGNPAEQFSATPDAMEPEFKNLLASFREKRNEYLEKREEEKRENLEKKKAIIVELATLADDIDNINVHFPKFQQLQQDFKNGGEVPQGAENEVWKNYQAVVELFYDRLKMNKELRDLDFKKNLEIKQSIVEKAKELAELPDPIEAFRKLQELHDQWRETGPVAKEIRDEIWNEFKETSTIINKRHQDYFQERKSEEAANEAKKTELCEKVEAIDLNAITSFVDWDAKTKEIVEIQQQYKETGFASRKANSELFARFRKACDDFFTAKSEYYKKAKNEFKENYQKKENLCERAEALIAKAEEKGSLEAMQALQQEWRTVGVVRRKLGDEIWKRFCAAVDAFHEARKKHFGERKNTELDNLKAKQAIIASLREISEDSDRRDVIGQIRELQNKWQEIGFVPFRQKDAINEEYRKELNRLFSAFDMRENTQRLRRFAGEVKKLEGDENKLGRERERLLRAIEARQAEIKTIENNLGFFKFNSGSNMVKDYERKIEKIKEDIAQINEKIALLDNPEK